MAILRDTSDVVSNWRNRAQGHAGIEYELIPFLETNDNSFSVSYLIGGNHERYDQPNINARTSQILATHALSIYYVKHMKWIDLSGSGAVTSIATEPDRFALGANAGARIYITRSLTFEFSANAGYRRNGINAPLSPNTGNPLYLLIGGASVGQPFTYFLNMNISYTWGNTLVRQKDTRWQFTPNSLPINF